MAQQVSLPSCDVTIRCSLQRSLAFGVVTGAAPNRRGSGLAPEVVIKDVLDQWRSRNQRQTDQRSGD